MRIRSCGITDVGRVRQRNEDVFVDEENFFVVADGMGGHRAGNVAAQMAVDALLEVVSRRNLKESVEEAGALIHEGIVVANDVVYRRSLEEREMRGMGTTLCCLYLCCGEAIYGHVGDSRLYCLKSGRLEQLTVDHSLVANLVKSGELTPEQAENSTRKSVITRAVGTAAGVEPDIASKSLQTPQLFMLCTDGLSTQVPREEMESILNSESDLADAASKLVKAAYDRGAPDNITLILIEVNENLSRQ